MQPATRPAARHHLALAVADGVAGRPRVDVIGNVAFDYRRHQMARRAVLAWFVLGSIAMVILNNHVVTIPVAPKAWITLGATSPALHGAGGHG